MKFFINQVIDEVVFDLWFPFKILAIAHDNKSRGCIITFKSCKNRSFSPSQALHNAILFYKRCFNIAAFKKCFSSNISAGVVWVESFNKHLLFHAWKWQNEILWEDLDSGNLRGGRIILNAFGNPFAEDFVGSVAWLNDRSTSMRGLPRGFEQHEARIWSRPIKSSSFKIIGK